jgi:hypothetical protein
METPVEIRYQGVVVGSATEVLRAPGNDAGLFLVMPDPLPVGTVVKLGESEWGRVEKVVESADPRGAGMYVRLVSEAETTQPWVPQLPEMIPLPAPRKPTPPGVPLVSPRVAENRPRLGDNGERRPTIAGVIPPPVAPERSGGIVLATPDRSHPSAERERPPTIVVSPSASSNSAPIPEPALREKRNTIIVAVPPPASDVGPPTIASAKVSGEFQARQPTPVEVPRIPTPGQFPVPATIVIAPDPLGDTRDGTVMAPMDNPPSEEVTPTPAPDEGPSLDSLQPARPLPPPDGRRKTSRRRRNTR